MVFDANFGVNLTQKKVVIGLHTILRPLRWVNEIYIHIQKFPLPCNLYRYYVQILEI